MTTLQTASERAFRALREELDAGLVHVWWVRGADLNDPRWEASAHLMSELERTRCARYRFQRDKTLCRAARVLTRILLSGYAERLPAELTFSAGTHGRPELVDGAGLDFNLSHTDGLLAVALTTLGRVGVDVEHVQRDLDLVTMAPTVYSPRELEWLGDPGTAQHRDRFFTLWTLKEAYLKVLGVGMSADLTAVSIVPRDEVSALGPPGLTFRHLSLAPAHRVALATSGFAPKSVRFLAAPADLP